MSKKFVDDMRKWADKTNTNLETVIKASIIELSTRIIKATPVGDPTYWKSGRAPAGYIGGSARGNWLPSVGNPRLQPIDRIEPLGTEVIEDVVNIAPEAVGDIFYLTNNLPYIGRLEYEGWSTQAPAGMVRINVTAFRQALERNIENLN